MADRNTGKETSKRGNKPEEIVANYLGGYSGLAVDAIKKRKRRMREEMEKLGY